MFQAVPVDPTSFNSRKKLPADWCGLRDDVLSEKVSILLNKHTCLNDCKYAATVLVNVIHFIPPQISFPGAIFIHASGFIGGHKTYEGALHIAAQAVIID